MSNQKESKNSQYECCAFCNSDKLTKIMDFGEVALAGGFLMPENFTSEPTYPLRLFFCNDCLAVQVIDLVDPVVLFKDYFYFSSAIRTLREHFADYATEITSRFLKPSSATVLEFGCNDGVLLRPLADQGIQTVIGVDPATNVINTINDPRITIVNDFFNENTAKTIVGKHGKVDAVFANNVYAHIPDIQGTTRAINNILNEDGVFVFEAHYLGKIINGIQYDMIYHEHLYYYSLLSLTNHLEAHGLMIFDVKPVATHGGSMRYYACKKGSRHSASISSRVTRLRDEELALGYDRPETFAQFAAKVLDRKTKLMDLLGRLKKEGRTVAGYGASGRANTIIQYCGITHDHMSYIIDDSPAKHGYYTPGSHFLIRPNEALETDLPDYLLIFAWSFYSEISEKCSDFLDKGGQMIVPLPDVQMIKRPTSNINL